MNTNMTDNSTRDPAEIEQDIQRTQNEMSRTVDKIGDQLTARNIFNALLDKADENNVDARMLIDGARRNPVALGLIAAGAIWLVSDKDSKFPSVSTGKSKSRNDEFDGFDDQDIHHRDYVSHMSSVDVREGEDDVSYQRRRDIARANFLMCERRPDEDEHGFRQRLDEMTDKFREKRRAWSDSAGRAGSATKDQATMAVSKTQDFYNSNPLIGGILAAAVGAALGSGIPISRKEQEKLGNVGEKARNLASEQKDQIASKLHEKKDEIVGKAEENLQPSQDRQPTSGQQTGDGHQPSQRSPELSRF